MLSTHLETKALYNALVMIPHHTKPLSPIKSWERKERRTSSLEDLFQEVKELGVELDSKQFYQWSSDCETPEELVELLAESDDLKKLDHLYLVLFELWRRLSPEKRSLSIVADDIDHLIFAFDQEQEVEDVEVESLITEWCLLIDSLKDSGFTRQEAFQTIEPFFAHNVQEFIVDFLLEVVQREDPSFAIHMLDKVRSYCLRDSLWIKFIELQLALREENVVEVRKKLGELVSSVLINKSSDVELTLALAEIACELKKGELLVRLIETVLPHLEEKEDLLYCFDLLNRLISKQGEAFVAPLLKKSSSLELKALLTTSLQKMQS